MVWGKVPPTSVSRQLRIVPLPYAVKSLRPFSTAGSWRPEVSTFEVSASCVLIKPLFLIPLFLLLVLVSPPTCRFKCLMPSQVPSPSLRSHILPTPPYPTWWLLLSCRIYLSSFPLLPLSHGPPPSLSTVGDVLNQWNWWAYVCVVVSPSVSESSC